MAFKISHEVSTFSEEGEGQKEVTNTDGDGGMDRRTATTPSL